MSEYILDLRKTVGHRPLLQEISQLENLQRNVTISSVFVSPKPETYDERLQRFEKAIDHVAQSKVDLMAFAETQNTRNVQLELDERFETIDGPYCTLMKRKAREHNCYMFFSYNALDEEGIRRNQAVLVGRDGGVVGIYNKTHLSLTEYEAGIVLHGTEVKSLRMGKCSIKEAFIRVESGEMYIYGMHISPYEKGNIFNKDPLRVRKLLLHKKEIDKMFGKMKEQGITLVPLQVYFKGSLVKMEIGVAKGKKLYDKRDDIAKKDQKREAQREFKIRNL